MLTRKLSLHLLSIFVLGFTALGAKAEQNRPWPFDYYILALTWAPNFCQPAALPKHRIKKQCTGFTLHGLWPQFKRGWPQFCAAHFPPPEERMINSMRDIMASSGLARHQWRKHGTCGILEPRYYFSAARALFSEFKPVAWPGSVLKRDKMISLIIKANPQLKPDNFVLICSKDVFEEIRICYGKHLNLIACSGIRHRCGQQVAIPALQQ